MNKFMTLLFLTSLIGAALGNGMVVFRLDDIQDYWIVNIQQAVINVFKNANLPMTIGIISNEFGQDTTIVNYVKECIQDTNFPVEIANHGYNHEDFPTFTLTKQETLLAEAKTKTVGQLYPLITNITTFIPPFDDFNANTITALQNTGYTAMSSDVSFYGCQDDDQDSCDPNGARAYPGTNPNFREYPAGTGTNDLYDSYPISVEQTMSQLQTQMSEKGFAVVMMHFNWYCSVGTGSTCQDENGTVNTTMIDMLQQVVQQCQSAGYTFGTVGGLTQYLYGTSSSGSSSTTASNSPVTTGKAAEATTGKPPASTTGKPPASTTGKPPASTTGSAAAATTGASSTSCTQAGYMRCETSETYQTCTNQQGGELGWSVSQSCSTGLTCHPSGNYIYCY